MQRIFLSLLILSSVFLSPTYSIKSLRERPSIFASKTSQTNKRLVGYWHNFDNGSGAIRLRNVSPVWNVINVAFGETEADFCTLKFAPFIGTPADFKSDIQYLQSLGKKVILSLGGMNGVVLLPTLEAKNTFVKTLKTTIDLYGFDGIDIDLENGIKLGATDSDFRKPQSPQFVNLIAAIREVVTSYGSNFMLTMAPEVAYVQGGISAFAGAWGGYLPIIHSVRDLLNFIHVQHYNAGGASGLDGNYYPQGTADFQVALVDMLLQGFPIAGNPNNIFPPLREDQVMIGLPASTQAAPSGGYLSPVELKKALDYIIKGISYGGKYQLRKAGGYPNFAGLMTWSINWDVFNKNEFSNFFTSYFGSGSGGIPVPIQTLKPAILSSGTLLNGDFTLTINVPTLNSAKTYELKEGTTVIVSGAVNAANSAVTLTQQLKKSPGTYSYVVSLSDGTSRIDSNLVNVVVPIPPPVSTLQAAALVVSNFDGSKNYNVEVSIPSSNSATSYIFYEGTTTIKTGLISAILQSVQLTFPFSKTTDGVYSYKVDLTDGVKTVSSNIVSLTVAISTPKTFSLKAATWTSDTANVAQGGYSITAKVPPLNTATCYEVTENGIIIDSGQVIAQSQLASAYTKSFTGKASGSYKYAIKLTDSSNCLSVVSTTLSIEVPPPSTGGNDWKELSNYNVGDIVSYNGAKYQCIQKHTAYPGYTPEAVPALWKKL